jgi:4-hydroxy-tetrahydrodipicolinate reductase
MKQQRVVVVGHQGKLGSIADHALSVHEQCQVVGRVGRDDSLGHILSTSDPDVVLELTTAASVFDNAQCAVNAKKALVVGASGLSESDLNVLDLAAKKNNVPVLVVPNFSIAAVLMVEMAKRVAPWLEECEIIEYHHRQKQDAPSGTSLYTAQEVKAASSSRGDRSIPIHSVRSSGFLASQDVIFSQPGEALTLSLSQIDRRAFVPGIVQSVLYVHTLSCGVHVGLQSVMQDEWV